MPQGGISIYIYFNNKQIHNIVEPFNKGITMRLKNTKPKSWNPFKASFLLNESHNQLNTIYFVSDGNGEARIFIYWSNLLELSCESMTREHLTRRAHFHLPDLSTCQGPVVVKELQHGEWPRDQAEKDVGLSYLSPHLRLICKHLHEDCKWTT